MAKKIALVDIDGCLLINGQLNRVLVEQLKQYDEVILFTQRSLFMQSSALVMAYVVNNTGPNVLVSTPDVVTALTRELKKPIRVSTSIDPYFGTPCQYYELRLKEFETELKKDTIEHGDSYNSERFKTKCSVEMDTVFDKSSNPDKLLHNPKTYYPTTKELQFSQLVDSLPELYESKNPEKFELTYFDDSFANLHEILAQPKAHHVTNLNCFVVSDHTIISTRDYQQVIGPDDVHPDAGEMKMDKPQLSPPDKLKLIGDLHGFIKECYNEMASLKGFFKKPAYLALQFQIRAAEKVIHLLTGKPVHAFNPPEMRELDKGKLKELTQAYLKTNPPGQIDRANKLGK